MNRSTGGSGTTVRPPGAAGRPPVRPPLDRTVRRENGAQFVRELVSEMRRVTWPTRPEWVSATILTIGLVISVGLYTFLADQLFGFLFGLVHR